MNTTCMQNSALHCVVGLPSGQHRGAQHHEDGGEAYERPAVQPGGHRAVVWEEEAGAAESHKGEGGWDQGVRRNAEPTVED